MRPRAQAPQQAKPLQWEALAPQLEKAHAQQRRPKTEKKILADGRPSVTSKTALKASRDNWETKAVGTPGELMKYLW